MFSSWMERMSAAAGENDVVFRIGGDEFCILTDSRDPATEYQYRQEGVNDYLTSPVNIPELIRRIRYFIAPQEQIQAAE